MNGSGVSATIINGTQIDAGKLLNARAGHIEKTSALRGILAVEAKPGAEYGADLRLPGIVPPIRPMPRELSARSVWLSNGLEPPRDNGTKSPDSYWSGRGNVYYRCRGWDAPDPCPGPTVAEAQILPWARAVMEGMDIIGPELEAEAKGLAAEDGTPTDVVAGVEDSLKRAEFMFISATLRDQARYLAEITRLNKIKSELIDRAKPEPPLLNFAEVLAAWDRGRGDPSGAADRRLRRLRCGGRRDRRLPSPK